MLCVDAELAIGQCRLGVHGTCGLYDKGIGTDCPVNSVEVPYRCAIGHHIVQELSVNHLNCFDVLNNQSHDVVLFSQFGPSFRKKLYLDHSLCKLSDKLMVASCISGELETYVL